LTAVDAVRAESVFFRSQEPAGGWHGGREAMAASQRARMLDGVTRAVAEKGYARVTVADVVARAGVSRRTFYEQFDNMEGCFLAAYETGTRIVIADILAAMGELPPGDWRTRARVALETYTAALAREPEFARVFLVDVLGAGSTAVALRQHVYDLFIDQWRTLAALASREERGLGVVSDLVLRALVGGIGELVQRHVLTEGAATLGDLAPTLTDLAIQVIEGAGARAAG
jgi:AcrR family transcriptional regulator